MTEDEAAAIARIVSTADSGCSMCISNLVSRLNAANLGFTFDYREGAGTWSEPVEWDPEFPRQWPLVTVRKVS